MSGGYRQAVEVSKTDCDHGGDLCAHALCIGHPLFTDFFANGFDHTSPANHGANT